MLPATAAQRGRLEPACRMLGIQMKARAGSGLRSNKSPAARFEQVGSTEGVRSGGRCRTETPNPQ